jgi:hypothetical protein
VFDVRMPQAEEAIVGFSSCLGFEIEYAVIF